MNKTKVCKLMTSAIHDWLYDGLVCYYIVPSDFWENRTHRKHENECSTTYLRTSRHTGHGTACSPKHVNHCEKVMPLGFICV